MSSNRKNPDLPAGVLDGISQVLTTAARSADRALVIHRLVLEMYETVQRLHEPDLADDELLSLSPLLTETLKHQRRMAVAGTADERDLRPRGFRAVSALAC